MRLVEISLNSPSPRKKYIAALDVASHTAEAFGAFVDEWEWLLSPRAATVGRAMTQAEIREFRRGLQQERRKIFAGEEWARKYLDFLLPSRLMVCDEITERFIVPWIVAWRRLEETGQMPQ